MNINIFDIFCMGVDYGQLLMEEERDGEDIADAFQSVIISAKYSMPSSIAPRRQPHSEEWRMAKRKSLQKLKNLIKCLGSNDVIAVAVASQKSFEDYL